MFESINTNNELSNFDIIKIIENMKLTHVFGGVYSKDQLPTLQRNKFYIINLESSDAGRGSHWTVFFYNKPLTSIYYDSFGFIAPLEVQEKITPYIYNENEIQNYKSSACGYYCIAFIKFLHNKTNKEEAFKTFLKLFNLGCVIPKFELEMYIN
jgi:hypothetical protein